MLAGSYGGSVLANSAPSIFGRTDHLRVPLSDDTERTRGTNRSMKNLVVLGQRLSRSLSTSSHVHLRNRVLEKQKIMQADNGLPVYLKGGAGDLILYRITMAINAVGCSLGLYYIILASLPKK